MKDEQADDPNVTAEQVLKDINRCFTQNCACVHNHKQINALAEDLAAKDAEIEKLKRTINSIGGGAAQGLLHHAKEQQIAALQSQLDEMTKDRNLWRDEHNGDCPNIAGLEEAKSQLETARRGVWTEAAKLAMTECRASREIDQQIMARLLASQFRALAAQEAKS